MKDKKQFCNRCKAEIGTGWEDGWPLYGELDIGFPAQAFGALCGAKNCARPQDFKWWIQGHPALIRNEAQRVTFRWNSESDFRLCQNCQRQLLATLGRFFGIDKESASLAIER